MADPGTNRPATIEDVAARAGVSRAAVSKVLRNAYGVSDAMRVRVNAAMVELSYRPRIAARAMRGQTYTIGIEVPDLGNQFITRVVAGASKALSGTSYQLVIAPAEPGSREALRAIEALVDRQVDGLLAISPRVDPAALERVAAVTPVVMLGRHHDAAGYDVVVGDDASGARAVMEHLFELGHRRIAHLTIAEASEEARSPHGIRLATYLDKMTARGLAHEIRVIHTDEGQAAASDAIRAALDSDPSFTAVFAAHDELAIGALRVIAETGAHVAIAGYDDVPIASHPALGLTTVRQRGDEMGARAMELLLERIQGRSEPVLDTFACQLVVRTSTFPPR